MGYYLRGEIAQLANINIETLRFYERNNLIPLPARAKNGYRQYSEEDLKRLLFITQLKECGFGIAEIKYLFPTDTTTEIYLSDALNVIDKKIQEIDNNLIKLQKVKGLLLDIKSEVIEPRCPQIQKIIKEYMRIKHQ